MGDVLIRGLSDAAIARIDADAAARGLSRQEYLRTRFETEGLVSAPTRTMTVDDLRRAAAAATERDYRSEMEAASR